jgi:enoyl-CoA hydratase/carnithine racemase
MRDSVLFARGGPVGRLVLNRPDKLNALDTATLERLRECLRDAEADPALRVLTITGAGRAFCAGADLAAVAGEGRDGFLDLLAATMAALRAFGKPLVGALNGVTAAGGLEIALRCDLLVAAEGARIADAHVTHGLVPGAGSATLLPGRIGLARARQMLFTGAFETAATLRDWGLINWVVPDDRLGERTDAVAAQIAGLDPQALASLKRTLRDPATEAGLAREHGAMRAHLETAAARDGLAGFLRARRPCPRPRDTP